MSKNELKKKRILIVDDDKSILESFRIIFEEEGYVVDSADTGCEAIEKTKIQQYDLALVDINLPDMEGTKLLAVMHKNIPSMMNVMITGYPAFNNAVDCVNLGADAYVLKPVNPENLLKVVKDKLNEKSDAT